MILILVVIMHKGKLQKLRQAYLTAQVHVYGQRKELVLFFPRKHGGTRPSAIFNLKLFSQKNRVRIVKLMACYRKSHCFPIAFDRK